MTWKDVFVDIACFRSYLSCSSEQAGDEEMVLDKATEDAHLENVPPAVPSLTRTSHESDAEAHYASTAAYSPRRTSYTISRTTLHDIENPAPELRMDRIDTAHTNTPSLLSSSENGHQPLMSGANESTYTLEEIPLDGLPPSSRRSSSFFASPAYVNRSRSRSIDVARTMSAVNEQKQGGTPLGRPTSSGSTLEIPQQHLQQSRRSSGLMSLFPRRQSNTSTTVLPVHQAAANEGRREALRNRDISAPISETLVRTSYT